MSGLAYDLDRVLNRLDSDTAALLENAIRDALALAERRSASAEARDSLGYRAIKRALPQAEAAVAQSFGLMEPHVAGPRLDAPCLLIGDVERGLDDGLQHCRGPCYHAVSDLRD